MEKKIVNGFDDLNIHEKLKKIESNLIELILLIDSMENQKTSGSDTVHFIRKFIDLKKLKKAGNRINRFLKFPLMEPKPGRPLEYPDSEDEKKKYQSYRLDGLSIRQIAKKEKMSPRTIFRKLKKYQLE
jgi:hypothetical protein